MLEKLRWANSTTIFTISSVYSLKWPDKPQYTDWTNVLSTLNKIEILKWFVKRNQVYSHKVLYIKLRK